MWKIATKEVRLKENFEQRKCPKNGSKKMEQQKPYTLTTAFSRQIQLLSYIENRQNRQNRLFGKTFDDVIEIPFI